MLYLLPDKCSEVKIGLEFNLFLLRNGSVWLAGVISQQGIAVIDTQNQLQCMSDSICFKRIECGYSHALLIDNDDKVYALGAGIYGQLGKFTDDDLAVKPEPITDINDGEDKVLHVACGAHFSLCYTELGILYYWGMLVPDDIDSIQRIPAFMSISLPPDMSELDLLSFKLVDVKANFREVLACDS